ncbi:MAG: thiamine-phosphate kinase [Desulfurococcaceae archaeon]
MHLSELKEEDVVTLLADIFVSTPGSGEHLRHPDDARDILPKAPRILFSLDAYTVRSLKLPWRALSDVGWAAVTGAISDVVSKGGIPYACMIGLGLPPAMEVEELKDFANGLKEASEHYGVKILGGDTNESLEAWISVGVIGFTPAKVPPSRKGLKPGDAVIVTGLYGAMGYVVRHGIEQSSSIPWVVEHTKRPRTRVEVGYVIGNNFRSISASMDVSDGLGFTLETLSGLSGFGVKLKNAPCVPQELAELCRSDIKCLLDYTLIGGEEYGVVMGASQQGLKGVVRELEYYDVPYSIIGEVVEAQSGMYFNNERVVAGRYDQFSGWRQSS